MKDKEIINIDKALSEKKVIQKIFTREYGYPSSVLDLLIAYFEERKGNETTGWCFDKVFRENQARRICRNRKKFFRLCKNK